MSSPRPNIPDAIRNVQARASDPASSAFVAANAGSGKTHVLVSRIIRLLLNGVPPEKILCVTFTKAAAANMAERVFTTLGRWVTLNDEQLNAAIRNAGASKPDAKTRMRARELFACALETPGGLKVQTIHALCTRLLQQFPFEANVPAHFGVLDDRDQNEMMERANLSVLLDAAAEPNSAIGKALNTAMSSAADQTFQDVVREACLSRQHFMAWSDSAGDIDTAVTQVARALDVGRGETLANIESEMVDGPYLPVSKWGSIASAFEAGSANDQKHGARLREASAKSGVERIDCYLTIFLDSKNQLRTSFLTKALAKACPSLAQLMNNERSRIADLIDKRRALVLRGRTQALLTIASAVAANYRRAKQDRGLLDYDDLIEKTFEMLDRVSSGWVHYKLDRGIDHVLIDEAQDTSPRQWDIVERIIAEFTSGEGARDGIKRTVFAVGDEKQSIFSFQGAAPREFDMRRRDLDSRFKAAKLEFDSIRFDYSFRSGSSVLRAVSSTFQNEPIYKSITTDARGMPPHMALEDAAPGMIDLWELCETDDKEEIEGWQAPFDQLSRTSPEVKLARRVQAEIASLMVGGTMTGNDGDRRPLRYGDILILVRRRGAAFDAVIQALKHAGNPVAGADRLKLTEHIAVIDLMHLADALLLPRDDLALAVALKSPLFGLDDEDLLKFAPMRGKASLRDALTGHAEHDRKLADALEQLEKCEKDFPRDTPFAFFARLLGNGGRARMLKRLGPEANDALDEFLQLALDYERKAPASMQGFMAWLRAADTEVKRDMEIGRDEVRVMTVHGAKGLEASVVFLIDTTASPTESQRLSLIRLPQGNAAPNAPGVVVWAGKKSDDPPAVAAARAAMTQETEDEYRRLLYVAMTRTADRLIVGGCMPGNRNEIKPDSWYALIRDGLAASGLELQEVQTSHGPVKRYMHAEDMPSLQAATVETETAVSHEVPAWLRGQLSKERSAEATMRPSSSLKEGVHGLHIDEESAGLRERALQRGNLVHRLLQSLPDIAPERRMDATTKFLARNASGWTEEPRLALAREVVALIENESFTEIFGERSRAEVSIVGRIERPDKTPVLVSGQIDRLIVTPAAVRIVDFKTNALPPGRVADAPTAYVRQLALYRSVLSKLYPGRQIHCALLWTQTPVLMNVPAAMLDAEIGRL